MTTMIDAPMTSGSVALRLAVVRGSDVRPKAKDTAGDHRAQQERPAPAGELDHRRADSRAQRSAQRREPRVERGRGRASVQWSRVEQQAERRRHDGCRANALDDASRDDHPEQRAQTGDERADREHDEAPEKHGAASEAISQATGGYEQRPEEDRVHGEHPSERGQRLALERVRPHVRKRDRHGVEVEADDECARPDRDSHHSLAPRAVGHARPNSSAALRHSNRSSTSSRQPSAMKWSSAEGA